MPHSAESRLLDILLTLLDDLARDMPTEERYRRLLDACHAVLPCDAIALLRLEGEVLVPVAVRGLRPDTLGRRFAVAAHPRLQAILQGSGPVCFHADSPLPDPYDGLVEGHRGHLPIHDCLGCTLWLDERPWGVLTLDTLDRERFAPMDLATVASFSRLAAATVKAVERVARLAHHAEEGRLLAEQFRASALQLQAPELVGRSSAFRRLLSEIETVAHSDLTVLIQGETGTGKELVAQMLHARSARADRPLITLNCAALPEHLVESELFGHVKGAFSGAHQERGGRFELAHQGTLLLDEVGELPLDMQAKLLRVLQTGQLQRVGSDEDRRVDVRILAATNRDLADEVRRGRFRADLYHRLSVYPLWVPPLRERGRDVLLLAGFFLEQIRARLGVRNLRLSAEAQAALQSYEWPGNVRELEHVLGRAALKAMARQGRMGVLTLGLDELDLGVANGSAVRVEDRVGGPDAAATPAQPVSHGSTPPGETLRQAVERLQTERIQLALQEHRNNWAAAARSLGLHPANLHRLAQRLGIKGNGD